VWGDGSMLYKQSDKIRHCYQRALACRRRAFNTGDRLLKADYLAMEDDWLRLARSHELSESVSEFSAEIRRYLGRRC